MSNVPIWTLDALKSLPADATAVRITPSCRRIVSRNLPFKDGVGFRDLARSSTLVVVGGGEIMDRCKSARANERPDVRLVLVPSIFGSGAEVSPVVVHNEVDGKHIEIEKRYLPDARVYWPELLASVTAARARDARGDVWSHALEAFASPLANEELRHEAAGLLSEMLTATLRPEPVWFDYSARACEAQSRSGVGLIHGISHTLEPICTFRHATLCANLVWPVLRFNWVHSDRLQSLMTTYDLDYASIERAARELFDAEKYEQIRELLAVHWRTVLRDRCTRMNGVLVRPSHLDFFLTTDFA